MNHPIRDVPESNRFETEVENETCVLDYQIDGRIMTMTRVSVPPAVEGRGIASRLTRFALDHCRENGLGVRPRCPYVVAWIQRHPDYEDLLVRDS